MKRLICTLLLVTICAMMICTAFAETAPDKAQETLAKYEKLVEGDWKLRWRYLPLDKSSFLSDKCKPANYWSYPGIRNRSGETIETRLMLDELGEVYLIHLTSGDTHKIMSFEGGWAARMYINDEANLILCIGVDGVTCLFERETAPAKEIKR